jgi:mono/diheme cytochrome c family protein
MRKIAITFVLALIILPLIGYVVILPSLGRDTRNTDLDAFIGDAERGAYILRMGGCVACHTEPEGGLFLAGGPKVETAFGTFYSPNITPDPEFGIGDMSLDDFYKAMTSGLSPEGDHYFPAFPYTSYAKLDSQDIVDLKAYLDTVQPAQTLNRDHDILWPFSERRLIGGWKLLAHSPSPYQEADGREAIWNRGAYLVMGPGHCGECHTARNLFGVQVDAALEGTPKSLFTPAAPAIAGERSTIADWTADDITFYLSTGLKPDGDVSGGKMADVIDHATSHLSDDDLNAMAVFLLDPGRLQ